MSTAVIIPALDREEMTADCIARVRATAPSAEIVLVDNGSRPRLDLDADVTVRVPENRGFAVGCNLGASITNADILVFLNNDTLPFAGWLEPLETFAREAPAASSWLVGPKLVYPDLRVQCAGVDLGMIDGVLTAWNVQEERERGIVPALAGACLAISRGAFETLNGFDPSFWCGYEDVDLCLRARALNIGCWYEPSSVVLHYESQSGSERWRAVRRNIALLNERWSEAWQMPSMS